MIELKNITKHFGDKQLFTDYNLNIATNDKVLLTAPSGSGKTTLIRMIMGFEIPESGTVAVNSEEMNKHSLKHIRRQIAYVSQDTDLSLGTVQEQLDMIFSYKVNRHIDDYSRQFMEQCSSFNLPDSILHEEVIQLSGGERQRVALIIALLLDRHLLILDEITSGLDETLKMQIADQIMTLDKTVIIVSHDSVWRHYPSLKEVAL